VIEALPGWTALGAAVGMGLLGGPHCVGRCGGLATALTPGAEAGDRRAGLVVPLLLGAGRVGTYAVLGALAGGLGGAAASGLGAAAGPTLRIGLGVVLVLVGLSLAGWWPGALGWLERGAGRVWRRIVPLSGRVLPVRTPLRALGAGALWGLLPCGLVYGALAGAVVAGSAPAGAAWMASFGVGTLPAVLGAGWLAGALRTWASRRGVRRLAGALLVASGVWTVAAPVAMQRLHAMHATATAARADHVPHAGHGRAHAIPGRATETGRHDAAPEQAAARPEAAAGSIDAAAAARTQSAPPADG